MTKFCPPWLFLEALVKTHVTINVVMNTTLNEVAVATTKT
jgi:hypothetical protein